MRYAYRCDACRLTFPDRGDTIGARADRARHRARTHEEARPDDRIDPVPGPLDEAKAAMGETVTALLRSALRSWRSESARELRGSDYWRQAVRLLAVGVGVLVLLALVLR